MQDIMHRREQLVGDVAKTLSIALCLYSTQKIVYHPLQVVSLQPKSLGGPSLSAVHGEGVS